MSTNIESVALHGEPPLSNTRQIGVALILCGIVGTLLVMISIEGGPVDYLGGVALP